MNFFKNIYKSIYSPDFYSQVLQKSVGSVLSYFFLLAIILTILQSIMPVWSLATEGQKTIDSLFKQLVSSYPSELEVTIDNGKLSTNVEEPYIIPLPKDASTEGSAGNLAVIDTKTPFSSAQFDEYNTTIWITKDVIFVQTNRGEFRSYSLAEVSHLTVNKASVDSVGSTVAQWIKMLTPVGSIFIIIGIYIGYSFRLLYCFVLALLIMLIAKIMKKSLTYKQSYLVGVHAMTLAFFVEVIGNWFSWYGFFCMFTLITLVVVIVNLRLVKITQPEVSPTHKSKK